MDRHRFIFHTESDVKNIKIAWSRNLTISKTRVVLFLRKLVGSMHLNKYFYFSIFSMLVLIFFIARTFLGLLVLGLIYLKVQLRERKTCPTILSSEY